MANGTQPCHVVNVVRQQRGIGGRLVQKPANRHGLSKRAAVAGFQRGYQTKRVDGPVSGLVLFTAIAQHMHGNRCVVEILGVQDNAHPKRSGRAKIGVEVHGILRLTVKFYPWIAFPWLAGWLADRWLLRSSRLPGRCRASRPSYSRWPLYSVCLPFSYLFISFVQG